MGRRLTFWVIALGVVLAGTATGLLLSVQPLPLPGARRPAPPVRHEDPAAAVEEADAPALFEWYLASLSEFRARRFPEGRQIVVRLTGANLPPEIASLAGDINLLLIKEGSILEVSEEWLRAAAALIAGGRIEASGPLLAQVERYARRGLVLMDDLAEGFQELGRRSGVEALGPEATARKAYEEVRRLLPELKAMLAQYQQAAAEMGRLTASEVRAIAAAVRSAALAAGLGPPPETDLLSQLAAGLLPPELVEAVTYPTRITLDAASPAYPGRHFAVRVTVTEEAPVPSQRPMVLRLDDETLATFSIGSTTYRLLLPPGTTPGVHVVGAAVPAQGPYQAATAQIALRVERAVSTVRATVPRTALAPGRLRVSGRAVSRFGPLAAALVEVSTAPAVATTRTSAAGEFALTLRLPGSLDLVGRETVTVRVLPEEPWNAPGGLEGSVFVINLINATLAGLIALMLVLAGQSYRRSRGARWPALVPALTAVPAPHRPLADSVPAAAAEEQPPPARSPRQEIIAAYLEALEVIRRTTGMEPTTAMTVREYAVMVGPRLAAGAFGQLTDLVEVVVYSVHAVTPDMPMLARRLSARVKHEVARAAG